MSETKKMKVHREERRVVREEVEIPLLEEGSWFAIEGKIYEVRYLSTKGGGRKAVLRLTFVRDIENGSEA